MNDERSRMIISSISLGNLKELSLDLELRGVNVIVGGNGTGKSVFNKLVWYCNFIALSHYSHTLINIGNADRLTQEHVRDTCSMLFDDALDISMTYITDIYKLNIIIEKSELKVFNLDIIKGEKFNADNLDNPIYASTETRLFGAYNRYVTLLRKFNIPHLTTQKDVMQFKGIFKIYDLLTLEHIRTKSVLFEKSGGSIDLTPLSKFLDDPKLKDNQLIIRRSIPYYKYGNEISKLTSLGAGTQTFLMQTTFLVGDSLELNLPKQS